MSRITLSRTVDAIVARSYGVRWSDLSDGFALVARHEGYVLTASPKLSDGEALSERVIIARENGSPMRHGHFLTPRERERAVRAILGL